MRKVGQMSLAAVLVVSTLGNKYRMVWMERENHSANNLVASSMISAGTATWIGLGKSEDNSYTCSGIKAPNFFLALYTARLMSSNVIQIFPSTGYTGGDGYVLLRALFFPLLDLYWEFFGSFGSFVVLGWEFWEDPVLFV